MDILIENQILSPVDIYDLYRRAHTVFIEKHDHYTKRTYRNRFKIIAPHGIQTVSIPVKHKNPSPYFKDTLISYDTNWTGRLHNTLRTCYGSAPYFLYFGEDIAAIFRKKYRYLYDLNNVLREFIFDILQIDTKTRYTTRYIHQYPPEITDLREKFLPTATFDSPVHPYYPQVFEYKYGFVPHMSILDYLFNAGTDGFLSQSAG